MRIPDTLFFVKGIFVSLYYLVFYDIPGLFKLRDYFKKYRFVKKIAFQAYSPHLAQIFISILNELKNEKGLEIFFLINFHPYYGIKGMQELKRYLINTMHIEERYIRFMHHSLWIKYDCLICTDVYARFPIPRCRRVLIPHGPGLSKRIVTKNFFRKSIFDFDYYFLSGDFDLSRVKGLIIDKPKVLKGGIPFVDPLSLPFDREAVRKSLGIKNGKKILLFAPTWGPAYIKKDIVSGYFSEVINILLKEDMIILIKLHSVSFNEYQSKGIKWIEELKRYKQHENILVIRDINDIPYFQVADILLTDISSRSLNFMLTDRPVIITGVPDSCINDPVDGIRMNKILEGSYIVKDLERLPYIVQDFLKNPGKMSFERKKVTQEVFSFKGSAAKENVKLIKQILNDKKSLSGRQVLP